PAQFKVTYTSANVDWKLFHRLFDEALAAVRAQCGRDHPLYIGGEPVAVAGAPIVDVAPADTTVVLGRFAPAGVEHVERAACVAPFNFPLALSTGMSSAALVAGNAVVYKPAQDTPWTGLKLHEVYRDAGLPPGVFNYLTDRGAVIGDALWQHPGVDGVVFTGSHAVGMHIYRGLSQRWVKPCLLEMGGKNACLVTDSADLDAAAEGVMRSAFSLQNQKCSATSRVYVYRAVARPFLERLIERTPAMTTGDPAARDGLRGTGH